MNECNTTKQRPPPRLLTWDELWIVKWAVEAYLEKMREGIQWLETEAAQPLHPVDFRSWEMRTEKAHQAERVLQWVEARKKRALP